MTNSYTYKFFSMNKGNIYPTIKYEKENSIHTVVSYKVGKVTYHFSKYGNTIFMYILTEILSYIVAG